MGLILNYLLEKAALTGAVLLDDKLEKKYGESTVKNNLFFDNYIYIDKKALSNNYKVYDKNFKHKYNLSVSDFFKECRLKNLDENELGRVDYHDFIIYYYTISNNHETIGELRGKTLTTLFLTNKNWTIKYKSLINIVVQDKDGEEIIKIHQVYNEKERVIIEYKNIKDEKLAILIFGALHIKN